MVLRLPERRDYYAEHTNERNPVVDYYRTKSQNEKFFKQRSEEKIDLTKFLGTTNHLTATKNSVGVQNFKQYLLNRERRTDSEWLIPDGSKTDTHSKTKAKFLEMKEKLSQEKQVSKHNFHFLS